MSRPSSPCSTPDWGDIDYTSDHPSDIDLNEDGTATASAPTSRNRMANIGILISQQMDHLKEHSKNLEDVTRALHVQLKALDIEAAKQETFRKSLEIENARLVDEAKIFEDKIEVMKSCEARSRSKDNPHDFETKNLNQECSTSEAQRGRTEERQDLPDPEPYCGGPDSDLFFFEVFLENKFRADPIRFNSPKSRLNHTFQLLRGPAVFCVLPHLVDGVWKLRDLREMIQEVRVNLHKYRGNTGAICKLFDLIRHDTEFYTYSKSFLMNARMSELLEETLMEMFVSGLKGKFQSYYSQMDRDRFDQINTLQELIAELTRIDKCIVRAEN